MIAITTAMATAATAVGGGAGSRGRGWAARRFGPAAHQPQAQGRRLAWRPEAPDAAVARARGHARRLIRQAGSLLMLERARAPECSHAGCTTRAPAAAAAHAIAHASAAPRSLLRCFARRSLAPRAASRCSMRSKPCRNSRSSASSSSAGSGTGCMRRARPRRWAAPRAPLRAAGPGLRRRRAARAQRSGAAAGARAERRRSRPGAARLPLGALGAPPGLLVRCWGLAGLLRAEGTRARTKRGPHAGALGVERFCDASSAARDAE
jgi:hypothetical protein